MPIDDTARKNMVYNQVRPTTVHNRRLLDALLSVPRETFLPPHLKQLGYMDDHLLISEGRYLLAPRVFAQLVEHAAIQEDQHILVVGCGSGYSLAVLVNLCETLIGLESMPELAAEATHLIASLDHPKTCVIEGPLAQGHHDGAPYDCILIEGAIQVPPAALFDQLAQGGRLLAIENGKGVLYIKSAGIIPKQTEAAFRGPPDLDKSGLYGYIERFELFEACAPVLSEFAFIPHFHL